MTFYIAVYVSSNSFLVYVVSITMTYSLLYVNVHWGKADDRNCNYGRPKMADVESGKNLFCRLNCFYNVF